MRRVDAIIDATIYNQRLKREQSACNNVQNALQQLCALSLSLSLMNQAQPSLFDFNHTFILLTTDSYLVSHSQLHRYRLQKMLKHKKKIIC